MRAAGDAGAKIDWASSERLLGLYQYQTLDSVDFERFFAGYLYCDPLFSALGRGSIWARPT